MSDYTASLLTHLAKYKQDRLGISEPGIYVHQGTPRPYAHILPKEHQWLNILEPFREDIQRYVEARPEIKLHRYFSHLNSSQAFALNLFLPYFMRGGRANLLCAMGLTDDAEEWTPELVVDARENTNVDMAWRTKAGHWTYCEVKLSEQEFGKAENDQRHRDKWREIYAPDLIGQIEPEYLSEQRFFSRYQILRNIWLAARDSTATVVFLMPEGNVRLWPPLQEVLASLHPPLRERVHVVSVEAVISQLIEDRECPAGLAGYAELIAQKYLPGHAPWSG